MLRLLFLPRRERQIRVARLRKTQLGWTMLTAVSRRAPNPPGRGGKGRCEILRFSTPWRNPAHGFILAPDRAGLPGFGPGHSGRCISGFSGEEDWTIFPGENGMAPNYSTSIRGGLIIEWKVLEEVPARGLAETRNQPYPVPVWEGKLEGCRFLGRKTWDSQPNLAVSHLSKQCAIGENPSKSHWNTCLKLFYPKALCFVNFSCRPTLFFGAIVPSRKLFAFASFGCAILHRLLNFTKNGLSTSRPA
jgi:hypothetical protein